MRGNIVECPPYVSPTPFIDSSGELIIQRMTCAAYNWERNIYDARGSIMGSLRCENGKLTLLKAEGVK